MAAARTKKVSFEVSAEITALVDGDVLRRRTTFGGMVEQWLWTEGAAETERDIAAASAAHDAEPVADNDDDDDDVDASGETREMSFEKARSQRARRPRKR